MNSGTIWGRFVEKPRGKKSRATVPLSNLLQEMTPYVLFLDTDRHGSLLYVAKEQHLNGQAPPGGLEDGG